LFCHEIEPEESATFPDLAPVGTLDWLTRFASINLIEGRRKMPTASGHTTAIRASRVIGTDIKDSKGEVIGKVEDLILDKTENAIMFAVVGFGGFLGMGEKFHPLPWSSLDFDEELDAYVVPFSKDQLKAAPADTIKELTKDDGTFMRDRSYDYYKAEPYWH
jgi:sporulation protein YlmC with PRC-barrel domain